MTVSATFVAFSFLILQLLDYVMKIIGRGVILMSPVFHFLCLYVSMPNRYCDWEEVQSSELCVYWDFFHCHNAQHHTVFWKFAFVHLQVKQIQKQVVSKMLCSVVCCGIGKSRNEYN